MSSDSFIAEQLLGRSYKGVPFKGAQYEVLPDSSSQAQQYAQLLLAENGLNTAIVDCDDEGTELTAVFDFRSSGAAYTAATQIVPKAAGWLGFIDRVDMMAPGLTIVEDSGSAVFINGPKLAIEETADFATGHAQSMCYALDTSPSLTPSLALGATGPAAYTGVGSSLAVNGGLTVRQAIWNQNAYFNAATNSWRVEVHIPLKHVHDLFRRLGARYGLPFTSLKVWWNLGQSVMPVTVLTADAPPVITVLGNGTCAFRYRKLTPTAEFERTLMAHLAEHSETYKYLTVSTLPTASNLTSPSIGNLNLGSIPNAERLWAVPCPAGAELSAFTLYPYMQNIALQSTMLRVGGENLYERQLALPNSANGQPEYSELFRTTQDAMVNDPWSGMPRGQFGYYQWRVANRYHCFTIRDNKQVDSAQNALFQSLVAADITGVAPSTSTPVNVFFFAERAMWLRMSYQRVSGLLQPVWRTVEA